MRFCGAKGVRKVIDHATSDFMALVAEMYKSFAQ